MKLLKTNRGDGYARIRVENEDDLWQLEGIIGKGDRVRALTQRTKIDGREKKTLNLTVRAEKIELQNDRLRVTGEIQQAGEEVEHGYHTLNIEDDDEFELWKDFSDSEWEHLKEAEAKQSYEVLFCIVESGQADLYLVRESGVQDLSKLSENVPGKMYGDQKEGSFRNELKQVLERSGKEVDNLVLAGPGFEKQKIYDLLKQEIQQKTLVQDTSVTGQTGFQEAVKRGALKQVVEGSRIEEETNDLEEFFDELRGDGNADYGVERIKELAEMGAVEKLLITVPTFRDNQELVKKVEQAGGSVKRVHTDHEPGERLENLGGAAALLRFKP
ncbi:mRNA surveillance protein pelota [Candidatus Nanohalococcus occultus]|uniref:Release factor eRF1 n=1 Tax=Candidatus Nanohalococcus occultus TaxID=2978047 RepID=A0ABY8CJH7_9ARCH|nr:Release factor eRF1 [Candidatus Nanohaloarchaeota archaeon SVXNc]